jgi:glycosyltransferase involved in cell wall biosynthesis
MHVAVVNVPLRVSGDPHTWITVPPQGYGGIQWVVAQLVDGLLDLGHQVSLLGAPGSPNGRPGLTVIEAAEPADMQAWLSRARVDMVHDHSNGRVTRIGLAAPLVSTHHLTDTPADPVNCVYLSAAQRAAAGATGPVVRLPVNPRRYRLARRKRDYLLFLGRVSAHKGAYEAAAFAHAAGRRLVLAGPSWEREYLDRITRDFGTVVDVVGEVGGTHRLTLIAEAAAVLVLSQTVPGPWGDVWCEPGATVVSEAAASGTPVVATANGCLAEIIPPVGTLVPYGSRFDPRYAADVLAGLPGPKEVRRAALARWHHRRIARRYVDIYRRAIDGDRWPRGDGASNSRHRSRDCPGGNPSIQGFSRRA